MPPTARILNGMGGVRFDPWAVAGSLLAAAMTVAYAAIMRQQGDDPAAWFVGALGIGALAAGYGAVMPAPHRRPALALAVVLLLFCGLLAILTIGLPILVAGALVVVASLRRPRVAPSPRRQYDGLT